MNFFLWGRDFVSVVRVIEGPCYGGYFYKERIREVSVTRGSTVLFLVKLQTNLKRLAGETEQ